MLLREGLDGSDRPHGSHPHTGEVWADLGSGQGAFTLALADLLGPGAVIHSVDRDERALKTQRQAMDARFPDASVEYRRADFTGPSTCPLSLASSWPTRCTSSGTRSPSCRRWEPGRVP